jgi:hypothetical protein
LNKKPPDRLIILELPGVDPAENAQRVLELVQELKV